MSRLPWGSLKAGKDNAMESIFITGAASSIGRHTATTVLKAVDGRQVHWFVTPEDADVATQVDSMPWETRRDFVKQITGY